MRQQRWNIAAAVEHCAAPLRPNVERFDSHVAVTISPSHGVFPVKLNHFGIVHAPGRLDPKREPVICHAALTTASPHIRSSLWARTIIPHARGHRARVGGTIFFSAC